MEMIKSKIIFASLLMVCYTVLVVYDKFDVENFKIISKN